jgi:uncharacterized phage-associated protein
MAQIRRERLNPKLLELILYISSRSECDPKFGSIKLNKLLFYSDFVAMREFGQPITNQPYIKMKFGPVPLNMVAHLRALKRNGRLAIQTVDYFGRPQKRPIQLKPAKLDVFSREEIDLVNRVIGAFMDDNARSISQLSHLFLGWQIARDREVIPYGIALFEPVEITPELLAHIDKLEAENAQQESIAS